MESFKHIGFEYSLPQAKKAELKFGPGQEEKMEEFMAIAKTLIEAVKAVDRIENVDREIILCGLLAGNLFGLFDQEERLRTGTLIFLGMVLNSFLSLENINFDVVHSDLKVEDISVIRDQLTILAHTFISKSAQEVRRYVANIYAPLEGLVDELKETDSDEDSSPSEG